ncbi:hypothetical protein BDW67DRAFT_167399 [Aspergillus spinulosporus]
MPSSAWNKKRTRSPYIRIKKLRLRLLLLSFWCNPMPVIITHYSSKPAGRKRRLLLDIF